MYFDIKKTTTNNPQKYFWVAKGSNGETLCTSEMLSSKQTAISTIQTIKAGAASATVYDETGERSGDASARKIAV